MSYAKFQFVELNYHNFILIYFTFFLYFVSILFSEDTLNIIKDNLYFFLDYSKVNGETGNFIVKLKVNEFNMNEI